MGTEGKPGRLQPAPENFLSADLIDQISAQGLDASRRHFLRQSFVTASAALASGSGLAAADHPGEVGEDAIIKLPQHSTTLGNPVAHVPYGLPSKHEVYLQRRESPGLTRRR